MNVKAGFCVRHKKQCKIERVQLLIVGLSCKDLSRMNANAKRNRTILNAGHSPGGTATTFRGLLGYLDAHGCDILLGEEVGELADTDETQQSNLGIMQGLALSAPHR